MPRRIGPVLTLVACAASAALTAGPAAPAQAAPAASAAPSAVPAPPGGAPAPGDRPDRLAFTIADSGTAGLDGSYTLECGPAGGDHPQPQAACDALGKVTRSGKDPFNPVRANSQCTMIYGGPVTAHVTGTWRGRHVDARFKRSDGCEIARWDSLVPALPKAR